MILPNLDGLPLYQSVAFGYGIGRFGHEHNHRPQLQQFGGGDHDCADLRLPLGQLPRPGLQRQCGSRFQSSL